ncbi:hypothetical protein BC831DRAFT_471921 [Entophlyctis helioformis]|nr:hypothetical protein BC831DRAFT_471921 [Entophlyctis helioformis]
MQSQLLDVSSRAADLFVSTFYSTFDRQRHRIGQLYDASAVLLWNGNPLAGIQEIEKRYLDFPITDHDIISYDCQPLVGHGESDLLVVVSGNVKYANEQRAKVFSQTFILRPVATQDGAKSNYAISVDTFRFV